MTEEQRALKVLYDQTGAIVDSKISNLSFDSTYVGFVKQVVSKKEFVIEYDGSTRTFKTKHALNLSVGDAVHVVYPKNNQSNKFLYEDIQTSAKSDIYINGDASDIYSLISKKIDMPSNNAVAGSVLKVTNVSSDGDVSYEWADDSIGYVTPEMYGAKGDGVTDDAPFLKDALESGKPVFLTQDIWVKSQIVVTDKDVYFDGLGHTIHIDGTTMNVLDNGITSGAPRVIEIQAQLYACDDGIADHEIMQYTEKATWQTWAPGESYHRGYISYKGGNPTDGQEHYDEYLKIRGWDIHTVTFKNCTIDCYRVGGLVILEFLRMTHGLISNLIIKAPDCTDEDAGYDGCGGLFVTGCHDFVVDKIYAENFSALYTAHIWVGGYGIHATGNYVKIQNCVLRNCKHGICLGGSSEYWCCGCSMINITSVNDDYRRIRTDNGAQYQQHIDCHPNVQDALVDGYDITSNDMRSDEEKALESPMLGIIEFAGYRSHFRNIKVRFTPSAVWGTSAILTSRQAVDCYLENVYAPNLTVLVQGWCYNKTSDKATYYDANHLETFTIRDSIIAGVRNADSNVVVRMYNTRCTYFTDTPINFKASGCIFDGTHFPTNAQAIRVTVKGPSYFDDCDFYSIRNMDKTMPALIKAPSGCLHVSNSRFYTDNKDKAISANNAYLSNNFWENVYCAELGHLVSIDDDGTRNVFGESNELDSIVLYEGEMM